MYFSADWSVVYEILTCKRFALFPFNSLIVFDHSTFEASGSLPIK